MTIKFDYAKARENAKKALENRKLQLIVLGHSGAGKSRCIGTLGGKILFLYGTKESHGPKSAQGAPAASSAIHPICFDRGVWPGEKEERDWTSDESMLFLESLLKDTAYLKAEKFTAIAVDGLPVLESIVKGSAKWKEKCKTTQGKHNTYKEGEATQECLGEIIDNLKYAQTEIDCHIVVTGIIDVKEKDSLGAVVEASPRLGGYGVAEAMIQHFGDIVVIGAMTKNGEKKYKFQFMSDLTKTSKDEHGLLKKAMNFSPRLTGVNNPPDIMDADLTALAQLKEKV